MTHANHMNNALPIRRPVLSINFIMALNLWSRTLLAHMASLTVFDLANFNFLGGPGESDFYRLLPRPHFSIFAASLFSRGQKDFGRPPGNLVTTGQMK